MTTYFDTRKRPMPFLEVSQSSIEYISSHLREDTHSSNTGKPEAGSGLSTEKDVDHIITFWTTLTKASEVIQNGKRLENMSWRLINRKLILDNDITTSDFSAIVSVSKGTKCKELRESQYHRRKMQKRISSMTGSNENIPTSSSSVHTNSSSSLNTSLTSSLSNPNNVRANSSSKKKPSYTSPPPQAPPPTSSAAATPAAAPTARVPSLFKKAPPQEASEKSERKTKFFIDHSSPESSSMSPPSLSPQLGAKDSIANVIESSHDKSRQEKMLAKASSNLHGGTIVASLFGAKNNSLHSLVNQVQRNQVRRPDPALPNNTAKQHIDVKNQAAPGTVRSEQHHQQEAKTRPPSLFGSKDKTHTPSRSQNSSTDALVQKHHHESPQQQQQQLQQLQQRHQQRLQQLQQQQQQLHNAHHPLLRNNSGDVKAQNPQIKSTASQVSMVSAASSTKSQISQASRASLFPTTKKPNSAVYSMSGDRYDDDDDDDEDDDYDYDYDDDSGWSSLSDDDDDDDDKEEGGLDFQKQSVVTDDESGSRPKPVLKRSLLSGLFLDQMDKQQSDASKDESDSNGKSKTARGKYELHSNPTSPKLNDAAHNATASLFHSSARQAPTQKGHYDSHHRSNAPPTAATLLPTALSTHMFLPTKNFQTFQSVQRQQYSGHPPHKPHANQHKPHANHQSPNSQPHQHKPVPFADGDKHITKLTQDNIAKYADPQTIQPGLTADGEVEYASSIKTSTSSIDIPGSQNRIMKEQRRKERQRELENKRLAAAENGGDVSGPDQLPSNLVDSINKENKLLFGHTTRNPNSSSGHGSDAGDDPDSSSTVIEVAHQHLHRVSLVEKDDDTTSPLDKRAAIFASDGFIDDSIVRKIYGGPTDEDEDDLNYHARGW